MMQDATAATATRCSQPRAGEHAATTPTAADAKLTVPCDDCNTTHSCARWVHAVADT